MQCVDTVTIIINNHGLKNIEFEINYRNSLFDILSIMQCYQFAA